MPLSTLPLDSAYRQAEQTLRRPSAAVWLRRVTVHTARFDDALAFYVGGLGLTLGRVDAHPLTGAARASLLDGESAPVLDLVEAPASAAASGPPGGELAFGMPRRTLTLLCARLDGMGHAYTAAADGLLVRDPDGTALRIEAL